MARTRVRGGAGRSGAGGQPGPRALPAGESRAAELPRSGRVPHGCPGTALPPVPLCTGSLVGLATDKLAAPRSYVRDFACWVFVLGFLFFLLSFQKWSFRLLLLEPKEHLFTGSVILLDWYRRVKGKFDSYFYVLFSFSGANLWDFVISVKTIFVFNLSYSVMGNGTREETLKSKYKNNCLCALLDIWVKKRMTY